MDTKRILNWSRNPGRPRTKKPQPDTLIRLLEPCSFHGESKAPGDEILLTRGEAASLINRRRAQLAADAPPHDIAQRRARCLAPTHYTIKHLVASALPCFRYCIRKAGQQEVVSEQLARELVAGGWAEIVDAADAPPPRARH